MKEELYPVITLWQPWASWIAEGWKTIETREHSRFSSLEGRRILIHAGQRLDTSRLVAEAEYNYLTEEQRYQTRAFKSIRGVILCSAYVDWHIRCKPEDARQALIECETKRWGLLLSSIEKITPPIKAKGGRGIWYYPSPSKPS